MIQAINAADTGADKTETESAPVPLEYARTLATARKVMDLSAANLTTPRPSIYSVWFNYVTGDNIEAKSRVRNLLQSGSPVSAYDLEQVHNECLAFDTVREASIAAANNKLENELADVLQAVQAHIASSEDYCGSLSRKSQDLTANHNVETIRDLIQTLLSENATMRKNTEVLGASLEQSRAQINQLHDALVESRMSAKHRPTDRPWQQARISGTAECRDSGNQGKPATALPDHRRHRTISRYQRYVRTYDRR